MNSRSEYNFKKFNLYVHEKGDFWPKEYFFPIQISPGDYKVFSFSMKVEYKVLLYLLSIPYTAGSGQREPPRLVLEVGGLQLCKQPCLES